MNLNGEGYKTKEVDRDLPVEIPQLIWDSVRDGHCISFLLIYNNYHKLSDLKQCKCIISVSKGQKSMSAELTPLFRVSQYQN